MSEQPAPEPTMEEILASIRRIISEDDAPPAKGAAPASADGEHDWTPPAAGSADAAGSDADDDVLELTERAPTRAASETHGDVDVYAEPVAAAAALEPVGAPAPKAIAAPEVLGIAAAMSAEDDAPLVSEPAASTAASAFDKLSASLAKPAPPPIPAIAMPAAGRTLEDLTRELLRPLLKTWLEENLGAIVQARVDEEVDRIARSRVR